MSVLLEILLGIIATVGLLGVAAIIFVGSAWIVVKLADKMTRKAPRGP